MTQFIVVYQVKVMHQLLASLLLLPQRFYENDDGFAYELASNGRGG